MSFRAQSICVVGSAHDELLHSWAHVRSSGWRRLCFDTESCASSRFGIWYRRRTQQQLGFASPPFLVQQERQQRALLRMPHWLPCVTLVAAAKLSMQQLGAASPR
jgi:hypothetical protein